MGLLATLPRATRGHLGASNRSLTRATRGYLQVGGGPLPPIRRRQGGLFAPLEIPEVEYRRIRAQLLLAMDGNSDFLLKAESEHKTILVGRLWITGASQVQGKRNQTVALKAITPPTSVAQPAIPPGPASLPPTSEPQGPADQTRRPRTGTRTGTAGLVLTATSRIIGSKANRPTLTKGAAGSLWLDGRSRTTRLELPITEQTSDEELVTIMGMLTEILNENR